MKFYKLSFLFAAFFILFSVKASHAQFETVPEDAEEIEMDEEQWEAEVIQLLAKKEELTLKVASLQKDNDALIAEVNKKEAELKMAEDAFWNELGGKEDYGTFKNNLERLEKMCKNKEGSQDDAMRTFESMNSQRMKCHPEFFARFKSVKQCLDGWNVSVAQYTVLRGDYLFMIAAKKDVYNNKHMWPIIWEANENGVIDAPGRIPKTIRNPHLIYPGQVLKIPKMTESLKKSEAFDRMKGWLDWKKRRSSR